MSRYRTEPYRVRLLRGKWSLRIYLPGGRDTSISLRHPDEARGRFQDWLARVWLPNHPGIPLPELWRPYHQASGDRPLPPPPRIGLRDIATRRPRGQGPLPEVGWLQTPTGELHQLAAVYQAASLAGWYPPGGSARLPDTARRLATDLRRLFRFANWTDLDEITTASVHQLTLAAEAKGSAHTTIFQWRSQLRGFLAWAAQSGHPQAAQVHIGKYARAYQPRVKVATIGDLDRVIALAPRWSRADRDGKPARTGHPCRAVFLLMRYFGLRGQDVARLPRCAFRLNAVPAVIEIQPHQNKQKHARHLHIPPPVVEELRAVFEERTYRPTDLPFGHRRRDGSVAKYLTGTYRNKLCDAAGVPRNLDKAATGGVHRFRAAHVKETLERAQVRGDAGASWARVLQLLDMHPGTLPSYLSPSTPDDLDALQLGMPHAGQPVGLTLAWHPDGSASVELREADGTITATRLPAASLILRRALGLVGDLRAFADRSGATETLPANVHRLVPGRKPTT